MCQYSSIDGFATDWHLVHLGSRAVGGAGTVFTEATAVEPEGRISPEDLGIWKDAHLPMLERIVTFIKQQGAAAGIQLAHAGRKASTAQPWKGGGPVGTEAGGWSPIVAPSALPLTPAHQTPTALDDAGIRRIVQAFGDAASRARSVGFDVVEIHAAHGYLLNEFLSPITNRRTDDWGGTFDNRVRLLVEVARAIRRGWPDERPVFVRISAVDWLDGGWTLEDSVLLARRLHGEGVDLVDCSSGGIAPGAKIPVGPGYQTRFAEHLRREAGIATGAVGLISSADQADHIIRSGQADVVIMARELLRDPYFALRAARELGVDVPWPVQYERAKKR
jgi:2,4-dienoyl-CoA reductase-like NADH-dependent reductase (Old Yellow Enzyme family)